MDPVEPMTTTRSLLTLTFCRLTLGILSLPCISFGATSQVSASDLLRQARTADAAIHNQEALQLLLRAELLDSKNTEVLCLIAKQYSQLAADARDSGKCGEEKRLDDLALGYAERAVEGAPGSALAHASLAICYARSSLLEWTKKKIEYSKLVHSEAERAVELDPNQDVALHVLGAWNYNMVELNPFLKKTVEMIYGKFPEASLQASADYFQRAAAAAPMRLMHEAALARTYAAMGDREKAHQALALAEELPIKEKDDAFLLKQAREAVAKM
jgi:tetratricopeptide (TPR) repeat protein